jgi:hypothetical protein
MIKEIVGVQRLLADISVALYKIAPGVGGLALVKSRDATDAKSHRADAGVSARYKDFT